MLQASGLVKSFGGFQALAGCSLEIARQSITGIIGPNGAGKSTLFNVLGGLMLPEAGDVTFDGRSILRLRPDERARIGVVDRKSTRLNSSHLGISYAVFCLTK